MVSGSNGRRLTHSFLCGLSARRISLADGPVGYVPPGRETQHLSSLPRDDVPSNQPELGLTPGRKSNAPGRRFLCAPASTKIVVQSGCGDASPLTRSSHRASRTGSNPDGVECRPWRSATSTAVVGARDLRTLILDDEMPRATVPTTAKRSGSLACLPVRYWRSRMSASRRAGIRASMPIARTTKPPLDRPAGQPTTSIHAAWSCAGPLWAEVKQRNANATLGPAGLAYGGQEIAAVGHCGGQGAIVHLRAGAWPPPAAPVCISKSSAP